MVFLVMGRSAENIEEKNKIDRRKTFKNEEKEKWRTRESQITIIYIFGFKLYFGRKYNLKKSCLYYQILFTVYMRCRIFETQ